MARKLHELKIDETTTVVIKELRIKEIKENIQLLTSMGEELNLKNAESIFEQIASVAIEDFKPGIFEDLTFNEAELIWKKFKEVNKSFFGLYSGTKAILKEIGIMEALQKVLIQHFASIANPVSETS